MASPVVNELVAQNAEDFVLKPEQVIRLVFERNVTIGGKTKTIRSKFNTGSKQFKEILEKYGISTANRWEYYDSELKKSIQYTEN